MTDNSCHVTDCSCQVTDYSCHVTDCVVAMHQAAWSGRAEVVEYLKASGSLVNATDYHGSTPLHIAAQRGHQSAVVSAALNL